MLQYQNKPFYHYQNEHTAEDICQAQVQGLHRRGPGKEPVLNNLLTYLLTYLTTRTTTDNNTADQRR